MSREIEPVRARRARLHIVATVHLDREAGPHLVNLLDQLCPKCVTVEMSRFSIWFRRSFESYWRRRFDRLRQTLALQSLADAGDFELLQRQIRMPFEWEMARSWAEGAAVPCLPVDSGAIARRELPFWDKELLTEENLRMVWEARGDGNSGVMEIFQCQYMKARKMLKEGESDPIFCTPDWREREEAMARRIALAMASRGDVVHVGGWMHAVRPGHGVTVASLLEDSLCGIYLVTAAGVEPVFQSSSNHGKESRNHA